MSDSSGAFSLGGCGLAPSKSVTGKSGGALGLGAGGGGAVLINNNQLHNYDIAYLYSCVKHLTLIMQRVI